MRLRLALLALVLALPLLTGAAAAQSAPVLVERIDPGEIDADIGSPARAVFRLYNLDPANDVFVRVDMTTYDGWTTSLDSPRFEEASGFFLGPRQNATVTATFEPQEFVLSREFLVTFDILNTRSGGQTSIEEEVRVRSVVPPLVFGLFTNPLPAPLDDAYGTFLLEVAFWVLVALFSILVGDTLVRALTARASHGVTREILTKLRRPIFYFVFFLGLSRSFAILPPNFFTEVLAKTFVAIGVGVFGLYVAYRILDAALLYYQKEISPRTKTAVDDVLIPLARKVGIVILYIIGIIVVLRNLGWDPTIVFAGAGIAGLVLAFAAQDTFSNLFSGVFLLVDRPFQEGDDVQLETGEIARVDRIGLRSTRLYHGRHHEIIVLPNNQLATRRVVNLSAPDPRYWVSLNVGVAYSSDPEKVRDILYSVARAHPKVLQDSDWAPLVLFANFGESSLDFLLRAAVANWRDRFLVANELRYAVKKAFDDAGIEIPFPQRTLWVRTEEDALPLKVDLKGEQGG